MDEDKKELSPFAAMLAAMTSKRRQMLYGDWGNAEQRQAFCDDLTMVTKSSDHVLDALTYAVGSVIGAAQWPVTHQGYAKAGPPIDPKVYWGKAPMAPKPAPPKPPDQEPLQGNILDRLAGSLVGDGKDPDLFFVCKDGICQVVCTEFEVAYENYVRFLDKHDPFDPFNADSCNSVTLESRSWGVICSIDRASHVVNTVDESVTFRKQLEALRRNKKIK